MKNAGSLTLSVYTNDMVLLENAETAQIWVPLQHSNLK